jgi:hypothetical protein
MTDKTKQVVIGDKTYTIKRYTVGDKEALFNKTKEIKTADTDTNQWSLRVNNIIYGVSDPKLTPEDVRQMDDEEAATLELEINQFNALSKDFLSKLQNSLEQARAQSAFLQKPRHS